jgi:GxxExxY protein
MNPQAPALRFSPPRHEATIPAATDRIATNVVDAAYKVHVRLGPGLLESVYEACLVHELFKRGVPIECQKTLPVVYDGIRLEAGLRRDIVAGNWVVVELKAIEQILPVHRAQLLTYLKISGHRLGLLINFNVRAIRDGIFRVAL